MISNIFPSRITCSSTTSIIISTNCNDRSIRSRIIFIYPYFINIHTGNVASATKLQTARTINGTSFNGTANITTANWGTARNLTIGGAVKSVNGSANVSFSLNEINAAYGRNVTYTVTDIKNNEFVVFIFCAVEAIYTILALL